jgi:hypothetical protein
MENLPNPTFRYNFPEHLVERFVYYRKFLQRFYADNKQSVIQDERRLRECFAIEYHFTQLYLIVKWFLDECVPLQKSKRKSLVLSSEPGIKGKTFLIQDIIAKDHCLRYGAYFVNVKARDLKKEPKILLLDNISPDDYYAVREVLLSNYSDEFRKLPVVNIPLADVYWQMIADAEVKEKAVFVYLKESINTPSSPEQLSGKFDSTDSEFCRFTERVEEQEDFIVDLSIEERLSSYLRNERESNLSQEQGEGMELREHTDYDMQKYAKIEKGRKLIY